jgi:cohesin domain-containing protein
MRRHARSALTTVGYLMLVVMAGVADASAILSVSPNSETVGTGSTFTVEVDVTGVADLYGYQFDLAFNPNVLQAVSSSEGTFLPSAGSTYFVPGTNDNVNGNVSATADTLISAVPGANGSGSLAFFIFQAIGTGSSALSIGNTQLLDSNLNPIASEATSGSITVTAVPLPAAVWLLLGGIGGLGALSRSQRKD